MKHIPLHDTYRSLRKSLTAMWIVCMTMVLTGCWVHEFPDTPDTAPLWLHLRFDTEMQQSYISLSRACAPIQPTQMCTSGMMRYIIRLYPQDASVHNASSAAYREYTVTRDIAGGYDADIRLDAPPGDYRIMVWADLVESGGNAGGFYDAADFSRITTLTPYAGSTDYRDAFRGEAVTTVVTSTSEPVPVEATVSMVRPLAKFEFVANDVRLFMEQQTLAMAEKEKEKDKDNAAKDNTSKGSSDGTTRAANLDDYRVRIIYNGYVPVSYNIFSDMPNDAIMGVECDGRIRRLSTDEASLGFDYVLVNGHATEVTVQLAIYDKDGTLVSRTMPVNVPLRRSCHTIISGGLLTQKTTGGVGVNPSYDGEFNIIY